MAKYIIDLNPDCVDGEFLKIPIRIAGENLWIKTKASLTPYTEPDAVKNNKVNLCDSCNYIYPECPSERYDVMFGDGIGKDNICCCAGYRAINEQEIRQNVENEVWEFAKKVRLKEFFDDNHNLHPYLDYFDSYQDAKAKHEELKKQNDEVHVGDELKDDGNIRAVVLDIIDGDYESYEVFTENGIVDEWQKGIVVKTGRHFDEIEELLKKIGEK